jgi:hypothetical protein
MRTVAAITGLLLFGVCEAVRAPPTVPAKAGEVRDDGANPLPAATVDLTPPTSLTSSAFI